MGKGDSRLIVYVRLTVSSDLYILTSQLEEKALWYSEKLTIVNKKLMSREFEENSTNDR